MSLYKWILSASLCAAQAHAAQPCLSDISDSLRSTLEQDNWTILQPRDLAGNDLSIWKVHHPSDCPGVAAGDFWPKTKSSYLVALIQRDDEKSVTEKLILVTQKKDRTITDIVVSPTQVVSPFVVWRLPRGGYLGIDGTKAHIARDSFVYEKLIGTATQFYYNGSHLKSFPISR